MKPNLRSLAASASLCAMLLALAACGQADENLNTAAPAAAVSAAGQQAAGQDEGSGKDEGAEAPKVKTTPLAELTPTGESVLPMSGPLKINATLFDNTVYVRPCGAPTNLTYDLNRAYSKLTTTVGLDDNSVDTDSYTVTFKADGATRSSVVAKLGQPTAVEIDLTDVLRLRIEVNGGGGCALDVAFGSNVGLGDAQLTPKG